LGLVNGQQTHLFYFLSFSFSSFWPVQPRAFLWEVDFSTSHFFLLSSQPVAFFLSQFSSFSPLISAESRPTLVMGCSDEHGKRGDVWVRCRGIGAVEQEVWRRSSMVAERDDFGLVGAGWALEFIAGLL
jgi:hypothetical protein